MVKDPTVELEECGGCDNYHPADFAGDCRDDYNRYPDWECRYSWGEIRDNFGGDVERAISEGGRHE